MIDKLLKAGKAVFSGDPLGAVGELIKAPSDKHKGGNPLHYHTHKAIETKKSKNKRRVK